MYRLHTKQVLPIGIEEAWKFLSDPKNLKVITPDHMNFEIVSGADRSIFPGQIIQYKVAPVPGIKTRWVTEITHVIHNSYFVDEQRFGPYSFWHHKHFLRETSKGTEMEDIVDYKIPFGVIGTLLHKLFIKQKLKKIFEYREKKLIELFGVVKGETKVIKMG